MNELRFDNQVAIITGGARGIGFAHAKLLGSRGAKVVVNDISGAKEAVWVYNVSDVCIHC